MKSVSQARILFTVIAVLFVLLDIGAAVVQLSPIGRSPAERGRELEELRLERMQKESETRPTQDMDKKLVRSREAIAGFYKHHFPVSYSDISENLGKLATDNHLILSQVNYDTKSSPINGVSQVGVKMTVAGSYRSVMEFINALEREKRFYVIDRVVIGEQGTGAQLRVDILLETYLRNAA